MMMKMTKADIAKHVLREEKAAERARASVIARFERLYSEVSAKYLAMVRDPKLFTRGEKVDLAVATKILNQLDEILAESGLDDALGHYVDQFRDLTKESRKYFAAFGDVTKLSGTSREALTGYIAYAENVLDKFTDRRLVEPLKEGLFQAIMGNRTRAEIIETLETRVTELSPEQLSTTIAETFRQYQRQVTVTTADELDLDVYKYEGPDDDITSDQCKEILDGGDHGAEGIYYKDEISADMADGLKADPLIAGGHINCRHKFMPMTLEFAQEEFGFQP